jgi:hypothetical protein
MRLRKYQPIAIATACGFLFALGIGYFAFRYVKKADLFNDAESSEGGAQKSIESRYVELREMNLTDEQWQQLLRQRVHQPVLIWKGVGMGEVSESRTSILIKGFSFRESQSGVLEWHLFSKDLLRDRPLLFLSLLDDQDPATVLTGIAAYSRSSIYEGLLGPRHAYEIANEFRRNLLVHPDVRMRFAAIATLAEKRWLTPGDIGMGLNDETVSVRVLTAGWVGTLTSEPGDKYVYNHEDELISGNKLELRQLLNSYAELAPLLLEHLNDSHFSVRHDCASNFRRLFRRWVKSGKGRRDIEIPNLPENIDWVRSDWAKRQTTKDSWQGWWVEHGKDALKNAHPVFESYEVVLQHGN